MNQSFEKPLTLDEIKKKRDANKKAPTGKRELLTALEKKMLRQEEKQATLENVEKKKRLKGNISKKEEYHSPETSTIFTADTTNQVFDSYDEQPNIDNMNLGDIVRRIEKNKEPIPSPDIDEKKKLLEMFRTDVPSEIDAIIAREEAKREAGLNLPHNTPWDDFQDRESAAIQAEKFAHHEKQPKGRWFENIRPAKENPHAELISNRKYVAHEDVYINEDGTEDRVTRYKDGKLGSSMNKKPYIQPERIQRESKAEKTEREKIEKKKGFLERVKRWFIKDPQLLEDALYEQNRNKIDRMLDDNVETHPLPNYDTDEDIEKNAEAYRESLKREQEEYDLTHKWLKNLKENEGQAAHYPEDEPMSDQERIDEYGSSSDHEIDKILDERSKELPRGHIYERDVNGRPQSQMEDLIGNEDIVEGQEDLAVSLDSKLAASIKKTGRAPRAKNIRGFTADR